MAKVTVIPQKINPLTHIPNNMLKKKRVAAYARVSTKQDDQINSYDAQVKHYTEYCSSRPDWEFVGMYSDRGITGTSRKHRVGFNRMIQDAMDGKIDLIVLKSVQRFARNTVDTIGVSRQLRDRGVEVIFEENNLSNFDPNGELNLTICASIAQEESRNISENVKWGKNKRYKEGITAVGYSHFLGYDKDPDPKVGFRINPEQAETVRLIYSLFMKGRTACGICRYLEEKGYRTPGGKDRWRVSTVESILTNEKYKGDARIQKSYVRDFLTHASVRNNGEVESWYVEEHHEAIIEPEEWELVQLEIERRRKFRRTYSSTSVISNRLVCGDCGCFYGRKVWHSTDRYKKYIYRCNGKYEGRHKCETPALSEEEIRRMFIQAYSIFMARRSQTRADCEEMAEALTSTDRLQQEIRELMEKDNDVMLLAENLIGANANASIDPDEFQRRYDGYNRQHREYQTQIDEKETEVRTRRAKARAMKAFIKDIESGPATLEDWDDDLWCQLVDRATVSRDGSITFRFRDGSEIKAR